MNDPEQQGHNTFAPDYGPAILEYVLSRELCARTIEVAERIGFTRSLVYAGHEGKRDEPGYRKSESTYFESQDLPEVYTLMAAVVQKMNHALYRFALIGMERLQVVRYGPGCFFNEHMDIGGGHAANRKLSVIVQLSDGSDYSGGDVTTFGGLTVPRVPGWGCVFPSWLPHRVSEITSGTRYALVTWGTGSLFV
jgi:predicted 2-oxoglutarate/Fe(II)-dependent dioxygenase YbiX